MMNRFLQRAIESSSKDSKIYVKKSLDIVDRIHEILEQEGKTQKDLALALGKTESEVSKWLTGQHNFTIKTIAKIEAVLDKKIIEVENEFYLESEFENYEFNYGSELLNSTRSMTNKTYVTS